MLSKMSYTIENLAENQTAIAPMTDEEVDAVGGGNIGELFGLALATFLLMHYKDPAPGFFGL